MSLFRADRLATLYFFHPVRQTLPGRAGIPILMYHSISEDRTPSHHPYYQTTTTPQVFEQHLKFLHENQYEVVDLNEVAASRRHASKTAVITFDDGFEDFYTNAFPLLQRYHYPATVFLPTAYIGDGAPHRFNGTACLTWSQVRELQTAGIRFGSHTVTHPQLTTLKLLQIRGEIRDSKKILEDRLSEPVRSFAYPYAFPETNTGFVRTLEIILEESGYENGVCTAIGSARRDDPRFFLKRLPMNSEDDPRLFRAKLEGGYDWLHVLQYAAKLRRTALLFQAPAVP